MIITIRQNNQIMWVLGTPGKVEEQKKSEPLVNEEEDQVPSTSGTQSFAESVIARKKAEETARRAEEEEEEKEAEPEKEAEQEQEPMDEGPMDPKEAAGTYCLLNDLFHSHNRLRIFFELDYHFDNIL